MRVSPTLALGLVGPIATRSRARVGPMATVMSTSSRKPPPVAATATVVDDPPEICGTPAAAVAEHTGLPALAPPRFGELDARPHLRYAAEHLPESLAEWAAPITRRMVQRVADVLGMTYDGQTLAIVCPWCRGVTPETPAGGAHTWRVRILPGDQVAIVCESGTCEPPLREVGTWWQGCPCWPLGECERLARLVEVG